jgi:hypothetical protein
LKKMLIPKDVIFPYIGTHSNLPSRWSRETSLDSRYPKAWSNSVAPNNTGGSSTHTHTSPSHTHSMTAHTHSGRTGDGQHESSTTGEDGVTRNTKNGVHYHNYTVSINSSSVSSVAVTYGSRSNDPPYYTVIYIKSQGAPIPDNMIAYWNGFNGTTDTPTTWYYCNGSNGTPDLRNKYLKGAATSANSGSTGGSRTNVHAINHSHSTSHTHSGASGNNVGGSSNKNTNPWGGNSVGNHTHTITLNTYSRTITSSINLTTSETVEPAYKKLGAIQSSVVGNTPPGIIGLWLGATSTIPTGWKLCDGDNDTPDLRDKFIKVASSSSEFGDTGGSNTHTHAAQSHSHTDTTTHTHTGSVAAPSCNEEPRGGGHNYWACDRGSHTLQTVDSKTIALNSSTTTANSSANQPLYRTVAYIMLQQIISGAVLAFLID